MQLLLRTGIQRSKKAPSALHPYGYMKDKFVWSLISAVGIFCLGAGVTVIHGFHNLFVQQQLDHLAAGLTGNSKQAGVICVIIAESFTWGVSSQMPMQHVWSKAGCCWYLGHISSCMLLGRAAPGLHQPLLHA